MALLPNAGILIAHAIYGAWCQITKEALWREIVGAVNESSILLRPQADGSVVTRQRFMSLLVSSGACLRPLRSDDGLLPMVF